MEQVSVTMQHVEVFPEWALRHEYEDCEHIVGSTVAPTFGTKNYRQETERRPTFVPYKLCGECLTRAIKERKDGELPT